MSGFVDLESSLFNGAVACVICYLAVLVRERLGYDDSPDAVGTRGIGGVRGRISTGFFA